MTVELLTEVLNLHAFQHVFPWDYRSKEIASWTNASAHFIHFFLWIGWAWDLKVASNELIKSRAVRTGDGTFAH